MALVVNTNVASTNAQRNLSRNSLSLNKALERLSSGLRINHAFDDAAGLAISNGLTAQFRGINQAIRNAGDGLSLLGTAEGAIGEQANILQRIRELAIQSATDTNSVSNRQSLNDEVNELVSELDRMAQTVDFNGLRLLDGSFLAKEVQAGPFAGAIHKISISIRSARAADIGSPFEAAGTEVQAGGYTEGQVTITVNGRDFFAPAPTSDGVSHDANPDQSALAYANAINTIAGETGVTAESTTTHTAAGVQTMNNHPTVDLTNYLKINGVDIGTFDLSVTGPGGSEVVDAINAAFGQTGVKATLSAQTITLTAEDGRNIGIDADGTGALVSGFADGAGVEDLTRGTVTFSSIQTFSVADTAAVLGIGGAANGVKNSAKNVNTIDISTKAGAEQAIQIVDVGLANLNGLRANIGAQVSRLNTTVSNLSIAAENVQASNSRILDADFAAETAELTRTQILQQAAISVLSQANQVPQLALSLLQ